MAVGANEHLIQTLSDSSTEKATAQTSLALKSLGNLQRQLPPKTRLRSLDHESQHESRVTTRPSCKGTINSRCTTRIEAAFRIVTRSKLFSLYMYLLPPTKHQGAVLNQDLVLKTGRPDEGPPRKQECTHKHSSLEVHLTSTNSRHYFDMLKWQAKASIVATYLVDIR